MNKNESRVARELANAYQARLDAKRRLEQTSVAREKAWEVWNAAKEENIKAEKLYNESQTRIDAAKLAADRVI
jgi:hypothetical protein